MSRRLCFNEEFPEIAAKKQQARLISTWKDKTMALRHVEHDGFGAPPDSDAPPKPDAQLLLGKTYLISAVTKPQKICFNCWSSGRWNCKIHAVEEDFLPRRACSCARTGTSRISSDGIAPRRSGVPKTVSSLRIARSGNVLLQPSNRSTPSTGCCLPKWASATLR